jgi:tetratricopeptide (TPR) repeat protein
LTASLRVDGLTGDALGERLRARLPAADDDARRALAIAIEGGTPDERLTATRRLLALLAVDHPVLLLVDDAEKSASARSLARAILRAPLPEEARVYVLASASAAARESDAAAWDEIAGLSSLKSVDALPLRPLSNDAIRRVLLAVAPLLPRAAEDIARRAQGVPGFAVQIVADLVRRGALRATADGLTPKAGEASALPDDLFAYWRRRVEDAVATLPADAVVHLELLAALGASVDEAEWLQACGSAGLKVDGRVQHALLRSQLARSDGRRWTLVHGLLRESLLRTSREAGRAPRVHRACADAIAQRHREGHPQRAPRVGHHLLLAGQAEAALPHLLSAAERLLSDGDRTPVPGLLAEADLAVAAASLPREDSRRGELRLLHATLLRDTDHVGEATAVAEALAREAEAILSDEAEVDGAEARVRFVGGRARWRHVRGDALRAIAIARREAGELESAEAILSNAHALLSSIDDDSALGRCYATWAWLARYRADWSRAEALFTEAHARFLAAGDVAGAASALEGIGDVLRRIGELDRAEATFRQAIDLARRTGALRSLAKCLQSLAYVALPRGQIDTARKLLEESHALYARLGNPSAVAQVLVGLGEVERAQGDLSRAEALYRRSLEMFERGGSGWAFLPRANLGIVLLERGDWEGAETVLLAARGEVLRHGRKGYQVAIDGLRLVRLAATGRGAELDADIDAVRRGLAELGSFEKDLAWAFERAGRLLLERGDGKRARALFSMAEAQCEGLQDAVGLRRVRDAARAIG